MSKLTGLDKNRLHEETSPNQSLQIWLHMEEQQAKIIKVPRLKSALRPPKWFRLKNMDAKADFGQPPIGTLCRQSTEGGVQQLG